jgi:hyperosmotically inducible periplasmic protein
VTPPHDVDTPFRDAWLATRVKASLVANPELDASGVTVEAQRGVIVLSGRVGSGLDRRDAEMLARATRGVVDVDNRLEVGTGAPS